MPVFLWTASARYRKLTGMKRHDLRLPDGLHAALSAWAEREHRSLNQHLVELLKADAIQGNALLPEAPPARIVVVPNAPISSRAIVEDIARSELERRATVEGSVVKRSKDPGYHEGPREKMIERAKERKKP